MKPENFQDLEQSVPAKVGYVFALPIFGTGQFVGSKASQGLNSDRLIPCFFVSIGQGDPYIETATPKNESPQSVLPRTTPLTLYLDIDQANIVISQLQCWVKTNSEK